MKYGYIAVLFSMLFGISDPAKSQGGATLEAVCNPCLENTAITFTGSGYPPVRGAQSHYMFCYVDLGSCGLIAKTSFQWSDGVLMFQWYLPAGTWNVCVELWKHDSQQTIGCTTVAVE